MKVLVTDQDYADLSLEREVFDAAGIEMVFADHALTEDAVIAAGSGCSAILLHYAPITDRVLAALPQVGLVARVGAGYDTVDTEACARHGVWVANSPDYGVGEVATHALALALTLIRHLAFYDRDVKAGNWHYESAGKVRRCSDLTLGIVGLGRIGKRMAYLSRNVFKRVIACDPHLIDGDFPAYVERAGLDDLFGQSDVISLHTLLNSETRGMVDARLLARMPRGGYLINTSRGGVVNADDLVAAVYACHFDGVGIDVMPEEPVPADHPLALHPRVVLTPHAAFYSVEAERELRRKAAQNIATWFRTGRPEYVVVRGSKRPPGI
ncbi:MAG: C-terminal binding protein [Betaproteobacteria bacterium]